MFTKYLLKSVAGVAAAATVLVGAQMTTPAVTTVSPKIRLTSHCAPGDYAHTIVTTTRLSLVRQMAQFGTRNRAHVKVTSNTGETPRGRARVFLEGRRLDTVRLNDRGTAVVRLPRRLRAQQTYQVVAAYVPGHCSEFMRSRSNSKFYTVKRGNTTVRAVSPNIRQFHRPSVHIDVSSDTGAAVFGRAVARLWKHGKLHDREVVRVRRGDAFVRFRKVRQRGRWVVAVRYLGTNNWLPDRDRDVFRVRRR